MDLSLKYSKTSKGAKAVLAKSRSLSSSHMLVLSNTDGKTTASDIQSKLQLSDEKFTQALSQLLDEAYIQVVQDFGPSVFDLKSAIEVSEISTEEFFKLELPEEAPTKTQEQIEAEERARLYAEEQARKEAKAREQEQAERKLLSVTDILANSGHKIDIEKLAESGSITTKIEPIPQKKMKKESAPPQIAVDFQAPAADTISSPVQPTLDFTLPPPATAEPAIEIPSAEPEPAVETKNEAQKQAEEQERQVELRRQQDAEQRRRAEAEAKRRAEEEARKVAERIKREEAEAQAKRKAEEKARKEEERRARKQAEAERKLAEQQAREEAKARARAEAERAARIEAERRAREKAEAEVRAREAAERKAREKAELQAQRAAEAEAKAAEARRVREEARLREERLAAEQAATKAEAKRQAEARAVVRAEEWAQTRKAISLTGSIWARKLQTFARPALIGLSVVVVGLLVLLHFVSLAMWIPPVEHAIYASIGEPLKIRDMRASLWPKPHVVLEGVTIGQNADITANSINVYPAILTLLGDHKELKAVEIKGLAVEQRDLQRPGQWLSTAAQQQRFKLSIFSLKDAKITIPGVEVPAFNADVQLDDKGAFTSASLTAGNLTVDIAPSNNVFKVNIQGRGWLLPLGPAITFDELSAVGTLVQNQLELDKVEGSLYGGTIQGYLLVKWANGWKANGNFELTKIDLAAATPALSEFANLQGRLYAKADINSNANNFENLITASSISARFEAEQGEIGGLDLSRVAAGREQVGGVTRYEMVAGNWARKGQRYQLTQVVLKAGPLNAQGEIGISPQQDLSGKVQTQLSLGSRQMQSRFNLAGKLGSVRINR